MTTSLVRTRYGGADDLARVTALHQRCSTDALMRRFHAPLSRVNDEMTRQLLQPVGGWSLVAEHADEIVGVACVGPVSAHQLEVGILVEDAQQGRGIGARLLRDVAGKASARGFDSLLCLTQPDNDPVLATIRRVGIPHIVSCTDGVMSVVMELPVESELRLPA